MVSGFPQTQTAYITSSVEIFQDMELIVGSSVNLFPPVFGCINREGPDALKIPVYPKQAKPQDTTSHASLVTSSCSVRTSESGFPANEEPDIKSPTSFSLPNENVGSSSTVAKNQPLSSEAAYKKKSAKIEETSEDTGKWEGSEQLRRWAHEVTPDNLTLNERLEKSKHKYTE